MHISQDRPVNPVQAPNPGLLLGVGKEGRTCTSPSEAGRPGGSALHSGKRCTAARPGDTAAGAAANDARQAASSCASCCRIGPAWWHAPRFCTGLPDVVEMFTALRQQLQSCNSSAGLGPPLGRTQG